MGNFSLSLERPQVIWRQIAGQLRNRIIAGELPVGLRLPSTATLAREWGGSVRTVHKALALLVEEGLLVRTQKTGTHVAHWNKGLTTIGVYRHYNVQEDQAALFLQTLDREIQSQATSRGLSVRVWTDQRPAGEQVDAPATLTEAVRKRDIQALISLSGDSIRTAWMRQLHLPVAYLSGTADSGVDLNLAQFVELSLHHLKEKGCRSAGIIASYLPTDPLYEVHHRVCRELGLETKPEWIVHAGDHVDLAEFEQEAYGYNGFTSIWTSPAGRPDGIIVYPDWTARGVVLAVLSLGIRAPEDIQLVFHKHEEISLFCPFPVTFALSSIRSLASSLLAQVTTLSRGQPTRTIIEGFRINPATGGTSPQAN